MSDTKNTNFSSKDLYTIYQRTVVEDNDFLLCKKYIDDNIFALKTGQFAIFQEDEIAIYEPLLFQKQFINRFQIKN